MAVHRPSPTLTEVYLNPQNSESIKAAGNELKTAVGCSNCQRPESDSVKLRKCAKCKMILYCSKECQTRDWPTHKSHCKIAADQKVHTIADLVNYFLANKYLHKYLELALMLELGLELESMDDVLDRLFIAQFYVGIEPCDVEDFQRLWSPKFHFDPSEKVMMKGMFQLLGLTTSSAHPRDVPSTRSHDTSHFANFRRQADEKGHKNDPLVECEFVAMTDGIVSIQSSVASISFGACLLAKELKMITISTGIDKPLTVATCLEFINMRIRQDSENQFRLRTRMEVQDVRAINYTGNINKHISTKGSWIDVYKKTLREKVDRESVYAA
ncbi:hypothetical protein GALMADRAFT_241659 [Galerina marginata CBS 339.88]|uniref:MYND-type domain-containing protein n=1 Tax=Galerina marginata (strain CBS 339.88) TaxID=685588 RepID=A0A067TFC4_GALM3|nr:hypothetical protein GALMADRAFT_241659 [Galerina marginata CBS 339.88]